MAKLLHPFDLEVFEAVKYAPADANAAADALLMAADYMRRGEPLPYDLVEFLAGGIESAMRNPARHDPNNADRGRALLVALHLSANNKRPAKADAHAVYQFMNSLINDVQDPISQNAAAKLAAAKFGVSVPTAKRMFRDWLKAVTEIEADMLANPDNYG